MNHNGQLAWQKVVKLSSDKQLRNEHLADEESARRVFFYGSKGVTFTGLFSYERLNIAYLTENS